MKWFNKDGSFKSKPQTDVEISEANKELVEATEPATPAGPAVSLSFEQMKDLMSTMARTMGEEMRKPTVEEQAKLDETARRRAKENEARLQVGKAAQEEREARGRFCNHRMDNGRSEKYSIGQQICSDGMIHVFCVRCCNDIKTFKPSPDQVSVSVG